MGSLRIALRYYKCHTDVAKSMVDKMPLTKLVLMDLDLQPYLVALLIIALYNTRDPIRVLEKRDIVELTKKNLRIF